MCTNINFDIGLCAKCGTAALSTMICWPNALMEWGTGGTCVREREGRGVGKEGGKLGM